MPVDYDLFHSITRWRGGGLFAWDVDVVRFVFDREGMVK